MKKNVRGPSLNHAIKPLKTSSFAVLAALAALSTSAQAQSAGAVVAQDGETTLGKVVVTSRNREEVHRYLHSRHRKVCGQRRTGSIDGRGG
jgi:redox-regulated HSP33 family molecular chaperone